MLAYVETETQATTRRWWTCARCSRPLGQVINDTVVIVDKQRTWIVPLTIDGIYARCKCGCENTLTPQLT